MCDTTSGGFNVLDYSPTDGKNIVLGVGFKPTPTFVDQMCDVHF